PSAALTLVGVTGTNGKTTTTYLLEAIWRAAGWRPGVVGTISYRFDGASQPAPLTTPDPIALQALLAEMRAAGTTHVALEVSSHALAQERVSGCRFDAAVFTNLPRDHLDFHGDLEHYGAAKARLFLDELPASGKRDPVAVVNVDDPAGARLAARVRTRCVRVGRGAGADVRPLEAETSLAGTRGTLALGAERLPFESRLVGAPHLENILGAAAAAWALGTPLEAIARGLAAAEPPPGRLEQIPGPGFTVVVDYAHSPDALARALDVLRPLARGRLITVFGCRGDRGPGSLRAGGDPRRHRRGARSTGCPHPLPGGHDRQPEPPAGRALRRHPRRGARRARLPGGRGRVRRGRGRGRARACRAAARLRRHRGARHARRARRPGRVPSPALPPAHRGRDRQQR